MRRAFSLLEVVVSVAIFAGAIVTVLSVLPALIRQSAESADLGLAQRMTALVEVELERQLKASGFDGLASAIPVMSAPLAHGWAAVASADGQRIGSLSGAPGDALEADRQYFLIEVWRFAQPPLRFESGSSVLPLHVRISWPYRVRGVAALTPTASRSEYSFTLGLLR